MTPRRMDNELRRGSCEKCRVDTYLHVRDDGSLRCADCGHVKAAPKKPGPPRRVICSRGHLMTEENTITTSVGRRCARCQWLNETAWRARRRVA